MSRAALVASAALALVAAACSAPASGPTEAARTGAAPDTAGWAQSFDDAGAVGTFVLLDAATGRTFRHDPERAARRYPPASTFKVYNALVALETGVVRNPDSTFVWDGVERSVAAWNRDHTLRSGMAASTVWLYQRVAEAVGRRRYEAAFRREPFGNGAVGDALTTFWLTGPLAVSADEEVVFIDRLRRGALSFSAENQATVRDLIPVLAEGEGYAVRAKTGWALREGAPDLGWIVGWVERPEGDVVFALNVEAAPGSAFEMGPGRLRLALELLGEAGVLPASGAAG